MLRTIALFLAAAFSLLAQFSGGVEGVVVNHVTGVGIGGVAVVFDTKQGIQYDATPTITATSPPLEWSQASIKSATRNRVSNNFVRIRFRLFASLPRKALDTHNVAVGLRLEMTPLVTVPRARP
jgi:hypothetical protein